MAMATADTIEARDFVVGAFCRALHCGGYDGFGGADEMSGRESAPKTCCNVGSACSGGHPCSAHSHILQGVEVNREDRPPLDFI